MACRRIISSNKGRKVFSFTLTHGNNMRAAALFCVCHSLF